MGHALYAHPHPLVCLGYGNCFNRHLRSLWIGHPVPLKLDVGDTLRVKKLLSYALNFGTLKNCAELGGSSLTIAARQA